MIQKIEDNRELLLIKLDLGTFFFFKISETTLSSCSLLFARCKGTCGIIWSQLPALQLPGIKAYRRTCEWK